MDAHIFNEDIALQKLKLYDRVPWLIRKQIPFRFVFLYKFYNMTFILLKIFNLN